MYLQRTVQLLFRPPLRQTEGLLHSLLTLMDLTLPCPNHTTLSRRNATVVIQQQVKRTLTQQMGLSRLAPVPAVYLNAVSAALHHVESTLVVYLDGDRAPEKFFDTGGGFAALVLRCQIQRRF